jgi:hypothetical protein
VVAATGKPDDCGCASSPFSPSSFSLPRLGNGVGGTAAVLLVCAEVKASSSSRVLHAGYGCVGMGHAGFFG